MADASCRRELELEIPVEEVSKSSEKVAKEFAKVARVPGFRPGKAPISLIKRRFAEEIKGEVLQTLVPETVEKAVAEQKLTPVSQPQVDKLEFNEGQPVKFRASFEVLPEFELGDYKDLEIEMPEMTITDEDVTKTLEEIRERAAAFAPVEGRAVEDGDFVQLKLNGTPEGGGEPLQAESVLCHVGAEETMEPFNENLRGANVGDHKNFDVNYPADYPDPKLAGKTLPLLRRSAGHQEQETPRTERRIRQGRQRRHHARRTQNQNPRKPRTRTESPPERSAARKGLGELVKLHDFPVPEALVEHQMDVRLERVVRSLAPQGVDPRAVNVDWVCLRKRQQERAVDDVKAELLLDRIATAENIDVTDEERRKRDRTHGQPVANPRSRARSLDKAGGAR